MSTYRRSAATRGAYGSDRDTYQTAAPGADMTDALAGRLEQLEVMYGEERTARMALQSQVEEHAAKLEDHGDGMHVLMDMLEGTQSIEQVAAGLEELRGACEEAQEAQIADMHTLRDELAGELAALAQNADLEQRLEATVASALEEHAAGLARTAAASAGNRSEADERVEGLAKAMEAHVEALESKVREASVDAAQRLQIMDAKHESLEHTLGIRFDSRLMVVEDVVSSVESRINSELTGFEEKLELEFSRLENLESTMAKKISDGSSQLVRLLDKSMATLDSQHNSLAEVTSTRFSQLQRQFDNGGAVDELRSRIEESETRAESLVEPLAQRVAGAERKSSAVESLLKEKSGKWDSSLAKVEAAELALERYRKRTEERMASLTTAQQQGGKDFHDLRGHVSEKIVEIRKDMELCTKAEDTERVRESIREVVENARETEKRLQDDIRERATKCGEDLTNAQRDMR